MTGDNCLHNLLNARFGETLSGLARTFGCVKRLTALFLAVVLVFGLASIALAVRLFQDVTREQSVQELRREATGLAALYAESALRSSDEGAKAPEFAAEKLVLATGHELYYVGASLFPGQRFGLTRLPRSALGGAQLDRDRQVIVTFTPPDESKRLIAAAQPVQLAGGDPRLQRLAHGGQRPRHDAPCRLQPLQLFLAADGHACS